MVHFFVSEIERASAASKWDFWYITNSWKIPYARPAHEVISVHFIGLYPPECIFHIFSDIFNYSRFPRWSLNYWIFLLILVFPLKPNCQSLNGFELPGKIMWFRITYHHLNKSNLALISRDTNSKTHAMMTRNWNSCKVLLIPATSILKPLYRCLRKSSWQDPNKW